jgi:hypothetical protein
MELLMVSNRTTSVEHLVGSTPCLINEKAQISWLEDWLIPLDIQVRVDIKYPRTFGHPICTGEARGRRPNHLNAL